MRGVAVAAALLVVSVTGCAGVGPDRPVAAASRTSGVSGTVTVFAASSLTDVFTALADDYRRMHPGSIVRLNFGSSAALASQLVSGAPADVFAAASPATMRIAVEAGTVSGRPLEFARNRLVIAVPAGNPGRVTTLRDLADDDREIALCAPQVPCGAATSTAFAAAGIRPAPDSLERDVRSVLSRVRLGEVDAGLVYRTDITAAHGSVEGIGFPEAARAVNPYQVAVLDESGNAPAARAFMDLVFSPAGQRVLRDAGFDAPAR